MKLTENRVVVLGVLYPGIEDYLDDYFFSLNSQTYKHHDIWIFNDGLDKMLVKMYIDKYNKLNVYLKNLDNSYTPAEIRELAIKTIKNKYDYLIFTDADDYFSSNRIEESINKLQNYDFCYNDMILVNNKGERLTQNTYFENKDNPINVNNFNQLVSKNFCGLSNTAINLRTINLDFLKIPKNLIAVDWWIFSLLLIKGYVGCFVNNTFTYYRQHSTNTVGGLCKVNEKQLFRGLYVKKEQYNLLLEDNPSKFNIIIEEELNNILILEKKINERTYLENYITHVNRENKEFMWWENIKLQERWITK